MVVDHVSNREEGVLRIIENPKVVLYIESIYRKKISDSADIPKQYVFTTELYGYRAGLIDAKVVEKLFEASMNPFLFTPN